jgi:light-harvesting protein B-800-850 alpha chain
MNQGRIWCVVNPNHGLPLFLGSVALISFTVHYAVLNNSSWFKDFFNGIPMTKASVELKVDPVADVAAATKPAVTVEVGQTATLTTDGTTSYTVKLKPKTAAPPVAAPG